MQYPIKAHHAEQLERVLLDVVIHSKRLDAVLKEVATDCSVHHDQRNFCAGIFEDIQSAVNRAKFLAQWLGGGSITESPTKAPAEKVTDYPATATEACESIDHGHTKAQAEAIERKAGEQERNEAPVSNIRRVLVLVGRQLADLKPMPMPTCTFIIGNGFIEVPQAKMATIGTGTDLDRVFRECLKMVGRGNSRSILELKHDQFVCYLPEIAGALNMDQGCTATMLDVLTLIGFISISGKSADNMIITVHGWTLQATAQSA